MSSEVNQLRVFKRNGPRFLYKDVEVDYGLNRIEYEKEQILNPLYHKLISSKAHVSMKKESKEIRKLMSKTGLNENELREKALYRKQIADSAKDSEVISKEDKLFLKLMKKNGNILKKPIWDESVINATKEVLEDIVNDYLVDNPYQIYYCECCNDRHIKTYTIKEFFSMKKDLFMEANILKNLYGLNHNSIIKKYMILSKIVKKKV